MPWAARLNVKPTCYVPGWVSPGLGTQMHWAEPARESSSGKVLLEQKLDLTEHFLRGRLAAVGNVFHIFAHECLLSKGYRHRYRSDAPSSLAE